MDISNFELKTDSSPLKILHPETKKPTDIVIHVISAEHPEYTARNLEMARKKIKNKEDVANFQEHKNDIIAACITGWEKIEMDGKPFKYSPANAIELVKKWPWIRDQVVTFADDRANFFRGSAKR